MLERLNFPLDEELYSGCGLWSRAELETMDQKFVVAVEAAFAAGLERREAAAATVQIKSSVRAVDSWELRLRSGRRGTGLGKQNLRRRPWKSSLGCVRVAQVLLRSKCALSSKSDCMGRMALWTWTDLRDDHGVIQEE